MRKICIVLGLLALSSCNQQKSFDGENPDYYDDGEPEGYKGSGDASGDSYYNDPVRNPKNEPRTNYRLW